MRPAIRLLAAIVVAAGCRDPARVSVRPQASDELVLTIEVRDDAPADAVTVSAFAVHVDGTPSHEVLIVPGSGRATYDTLVGPLSSGEHTVEVKPSSSWPQNSDVRLIGTDRVRTVTAADPEYKLLRLAPAIVLRSDTVGTSNDLPVLLYVEDSGDALRYTTVFTNEDGGTETAALFARWGRACDIEETYVVQLDAAGRAIAETFQGPEHKITPFNGTRIGAHPVLTVATRNNMFQESGAAGVTIRPVPVVIQPEAGTRESILDDRPWLQRLTARELAAEKKPFDPRDFVYLEAKVQLGDDAAAAAWVQQPGGERVSSDRGDERFRVTRDGWVRVAVPLARDGSVTAAGWSCLPRKGRSGLAAPKPRGAKRAMSDPARADLQTLKRLRSKRDPGRRSNPLNLLELSRTQSNPFEPIRTQSNPIEIASAGRTAGANMRRGGDVVVQALATD